MFYGLVSSVLVLWWNEPITLVLVIPAVVGSAYLLGGGGGE
jgi:hypothetical protein